MSKRHGDRKKKPDYGDDVIHIDQIVGRGDTEVDFDLTDYTESQERESDAPDIYIGSKKTGSADDDITYSDSRSLISRPGSEVTIVNDRKKLDRTYRELWPKEELKEKRIVYPEMDRYEILNAFREIRTEIIRNASDKNQIILVVSLDHGMGTSFTALNLAASFAYEGEKTALIVDCDLRGRKFEEVFNHENGIGLTDYLEDGDMAIEDIIYTTPIRRMKYIPVGHAQSAIGEFFTSSKMRDFVVQIKKRYQDRYIVLSAPPIEVSADAAILSGVCDQIVIVVPYGKVSNQRLAKALRLLPKSKITGIIVNNRIKHV